MSEKTVQCIYYSATRTTQKILHKVAEGTGMKILSPVELADPKARKTFDGKMEGNLILVGSAVYEGSIPFIAMEPFLKLEGEGKWAAAVGVYGNRSPEDYVPELSGLLRGKGFKIIAGAEFVAHHSYSHEEIGIATDGLELLGPLTPIYVPPSNNIVHPLVAYAPQHPAFHPDPKEVAELLDVALHLLLDPATRREEDWTWRGAPLHVPFYAVGEHKVWGVTAIVLAEFMTLLTQRSAD